MKESKKQEKENLEFMIDLLSIRNKSFKAQFLAKIPQEYKQEATLLIQQYKKNVKSRLKIFGRIFRDKQMMSKDVALADKQMEIRIRLQEINNL